MVPLFDIPSPFKGIGLWQTCAELAESPAWKPHERQIIAQLVDELKKEIEHSDDEEEAPTQVTQPSPNNQSSIESHTHSTFFPGIPAHDISHEAVLNANLASGQRPLTRCPNYTEFSASSSGPARKPISYNPPLSDDALYLKANYPDVPPTPMPRDSAGHVSYFNEEALKICDAVMADAAMSHSQRESAHSPIISPVPLQPPCVSGQPPTVSGKSNRALEEELHQRKKELAIRDYKYGNYHNSMPRNWRSYHSDGNGSSDQEEPEPDIPVPSTSTTPISVPAPPPAVKRMVPSVESLFTPHPTEKLASNTSWNYKIPKDPSTNPQTTPDHHPAKRHMSTPKNQDDIPVIPCKYQGLYLLKNLALTDISSMLG